jgi:hypothetical protein
MAVKTEEELELEVDNSFPSNNPTTIRSAIARAFYKNVIDTLFHWVNSLTSTVSGKAPIEHNHDPDEINGLLDGSNKIAATWLPAAPVSIDWGQIGGNLSEQTDLIEELGGKSNVGHQHSASEINSGVFDPARIPSLDTSKIASGTFSEARIPNLPASKITSGVFDPALIPALDASKITTGAFADARIPNLDTGKITTGVFVRDRLGTGGTGGGTKVLADNQTFVSLPTVSGSQGLPYVAGEYFSNVSEGAASFTTAASVNANTFILSAIVIRENVTVDAVQLIHPNTVSASVRVGLYTSALSAGQYIPDQLVTNSEQVMVVSSGSAGTVTGVYGTPFTLSKGLYFTAALANTGLQLYRWTANYHFLRPTSSAGIPALINSYSTASFPYAPLPSTYASSTVGVQLSPIVILFRKQ